MNSAGKNVFLCQPDGKKGCSACCGLFNFRDISKKNLTDFLSSFDKRKCMSAPDDAGWAGKFTVRDASVHVCPYQGFTMYDKPGCMVHGESGGKNTRERSIFGTRVCGDFLCPAHIILDDEHRHILVGFVDDWYLYSAAIIDPESFIWIVDMIKDRCRFNSGDSDSLTGIRVKEALRSAIILHAEFLNNVDAPIFQYAVSEYNLYKDLFTLNSQRDGAVYCRGKITEVITKIL